MSIDRATIVGAQRLTELASIYLREPTHWTIVAGEYQPVFDPPLSQAEQTTLATLRKLANGSARLTPAEREALEDDLATLRAFRTRSGAPTNAQVVAAVDSIIDVLRVLLRD